VDAGADFLEDNRGQTPLHCAAEYYGICATSSAEAVIRTLVKLGADLESRTDIGILQKKKKKKKKKKKSCMGVQMT
jgi:ankyrin repeat protein